MNTWNRHIHTDTENVHKCSQTEESEKTRNTYDSLFWFRYETFIYLFEFKVFWHEERERHNFLLCRLFNLTPPRAAPRRKLMVWPRRAPKIDLLRPSPNLNSLFFFFSNPKESRPIASGYDFIHVPGSISIWVFYCDICDCHIHPAGAWTPALNVRT